MGMHTWQARGQAHNAGASASTQCRRMGKHTWQAHGHAHMAGAWASTHSKHAHTCEWDRAPAAAASCAAPMPPRSLGKSFAGKSCAAGSDTSGTLTAAQPLLCPSCPSACDSWPPASTSGSLPSSSWPPVSTGRPLASLPTSCCCGRSNCLACSNCLVSSTCLACSNRLARSNRLAGADSASVPEASSLCRCTISGGSASSGAAAANPAARVPHGVHAVGIGSCCGCGANGVVPPVAG
eukprot:351855-Chlamydomonas_euryale.AAC.9